MELVNKYIFQYLLHANFNDREEPSMQKPDVTLSKYYPVCMWVGLA